MAKFGKLELTDDADEDTDKVKLVSTRKRAVATIVISNNEEDEDSSDLTSLPPSPAPVLRRFLEAEKRPSKEDNAVERVEATGDIFGSIGRSLTGGTSNRDDEDVTVLEGPPQDVTSPPSVQKKTVSVDRKKEDSDNYSVHEIPAPVQARNIQAEVASMKTIPYNKPSKNSLTQNRTILAASTKPADRVVHTPSTPSSSRMHAPQSNEPSSTVKLKLLLPPKLAPSRPQKMSSDIMSWNQSKRVQTAPPRPLMFPKPTGDLNKPPKSAKSPVTLKPTQILVSPFPFTSKALLSRPKRPLVPPHSFSTKDSPVAVASGYASADLVPPLGPARSAEIETGVDIAAPIRAINSQEDDDIDAGATSDISFGSSEGNEDVAPTTSTTEDSRLSVESSTPEQHTYVLTSEYDRQLYRAIRSRWAPLAQMREELANARLTANPDEEWGIESGSEGDAGFTTRSGWYGGLGDRWKSGDSGVLGMKIMGENGDPKIQPERTHTTEENVSVALAMRRYTEGIWSAAPNVPGVRAGAPLAEEDVQASGLDEKEENATRMLSSEAPSLSKNRHEDSEGLPSRSPNVETPDQTQPATTSYGDPSVTPVPIDTPTTEPSTAATLVNLSTTPNVPRSPPAILLTPLESASGVLRQSTPVQSPIQSPITYHANDSGQTPPSYDFSYESTAMHIGLASWDENSFAMVRTIVPNSKSLIQHSSLTQIPTPDLPTQYESPSTDVTSYRPTRHFLGVEPPSIPGTKRYTLDAVGGLMEGHEAAEVEESFSEVEDLSESELTPEALAAYQAIQFYHELVEDDEELAKDTRKRKTLDSESSAPEEEPEYEDYAGPKKKVQRGSRKRRKTSQTIPPIDSDSPLPTHIVRSVPTGRPLRIRTTGMSVDVPLGLSVDDIDLASLEVRRVRNGIFSTTVLCHQCRCTNTTGQRKAQCDNVTIHSSSSTSSAPSSITGSVRCNKKFCERCLRGWYAFDDDAVAFVRGGQRMTEEKTMGTGIGIGIVEGKWICPFCIDLCMCTICSKKRNVERTKYAPSGSAVIALGPSGVAVSGPRSAGEVEARPQAQPTEGAADAVPQPPSSTPSLVIRIPRRIGPPPVPTQWLPSIPTPTPGLDPIFYEATRPCTRDFPTGAPQPTAANHAPILYHVGADLENDGLEDSFTGSEMSEDEEGGENRVQNHSAWIGSSGDNQRDPEVAGSSMVAQATRKNFLIVTPGRRMPSTMKKLQERPKELVSPSLPNPDPLTIPDTLQEPDQVLDDIARVSLESPTKSYTNMELAIFDHYPATVDPMQLFGSGSLPYVEETPTQGLSSMIKVDEDAANVRSQYTGSPHSEVAYLDPEEVIAHLSSEDDDNGSVDAHFMLGFNEYEMRPNEEVQIEPPTLAMHDYNDFLPIIGGDDNVPEGIDYPVDIDGDVLMDDGLFSLLLRHPSSQQDPDLLAVELLGYHD